MALVAQRLLDMLAKCQEDLSRARQDAEKIYCEADKLFRPWSESNIRASIPKEQGSPVS
jgi:hypothetical protein